MELRSRKSVRLLVPYEIVSTPRRSARPKKAMATFSEASESESESMDSKTLESGVDHPIQVKEEVTAMSSVPHQEETPLKTCTIVLDRLAPEDAATQKEDEDKEEMLRRGGKLSVSRIPTFQSSLTKKRPTSSTQSGTELPPSPSLSKKEAVRQVVQPTERASRDNIDGWEPSKSKLPGFRETALPLLNVRLPKVACESPCQTIHTEQDIPPVHVSLPPLLKIQPVSAQLTNEAITTVHVTTVSSRPAIRTAAGDCASAQGFEVPKENFPTQALSKPSVAEVDTQESEEENGEAEVREDHYGFNLKESKLIEDEEPPWERDSGEMEAVVLEEEVAGGYDDDDGSSHTGMEGTEAHQCGVGHVRAPGALNGSCDQPPDRENIAQESHRARKSKKTYDSAPPPVPMRSTKPKQSTKTCCSSFMLFVLLPCTLLLFGGFGQHIWHYGLPMSVSSLMSQLELHWLEGCGLARETCSSDCRVRLVESIPEGLYTSGSTPLPSISDAWMSLLDKANSSVDIAAFYFSLRASDMGLAEPSDSQGKRVFKHLMQLQPKGVKLQIAVNAPQSTTQDTAELAATGAEVREVDLQAITGGIVHTKLWVVDQKHLYLGSANMDWRSLTQVKEVGVAIEDCSCLAQDASRIFGVYWSIGSQKNGSLPPYWPDRFTALTSSEYPVSLKLNGVAARVYLSSSPPMISARGRSDDLTTILSVISDAQKFVHISVMDYLPLSQFSQPKRFWPAIDTAIRAAACTRGVEVNLLVSCWPHSPRAMFVFLQSLAVLHHRPLGCNINVKVFKVPSTTEQEKIPFARVNHAKYMVTDRVVYIGTSNWSENYFTQTAGVGLVVNQTGSVIGQGQKTLQSELQEVFQRDWTSDNAQTLSNDDKEHCRDHPH